VASAILDTHIEAHGTAIQPDWQARIDKGLRRLAAHCPEPIQRVRVELFKTPHHRLGMFELHVTVALSHRTVSVRRQGELVTPLIVESFDVLQREVESHHDRVERKVKAHEPHVRQGTVKFFVPNDGYGFLTDDQGGDVYFHMNAFQGGSVDDLARGVAVRFVAEMGDDGLQAAWVRLK